MQALNNTWGFELMLSSERPRFQFLNSVGSLILRIQKELFTTLLVACKGKYKLLYNFWFPQDLHELHSESILKAF